MGPRGSDEPEPPARWQLRIVQGLCALLSAALVFVSGQWLAIKQGSDAAEIGRLRAQVAAVEAKCEAGLVHLGAEVTGLKVATAKTDANVDNARNEMVRTNASLERALESLRWRR